MNENNMSWNPEDPFFGFDDPMSMPPVSPKPKKSKLPLFIAIGAAVVILVVVLCFVLGGSSSSDTVTEQVGDSISVSIESMTENSALAPLTQALEDGSIEVQLDMAALADAPSGTNLSLKLYSGNDNGALSAMVEMFGNSLLDATAFFDEENVALASNALFGNDAYGIGLNDLANRFNNSVFGPYGEFSLGVDANELASSFSALTAYGELDAQAEQISDNMLDAIGQSIDANATVHQSTTNLTFAGISTEVNAITMTVDGDALAAIMGDFIEYFRNDTELRNYLYDYMNSPVFAMYASGYYEPTEVIDELYADLNSITDAELDEMAQEMNESGFTADLTFYISDDTDELLGLEFSGTAYNEIIRFSFTGGPSWKDIREVSFVMDDGYSEYSGRFIVTQNDKNGYKATLTVSEDAVSAELGSITWDKNSGYFCAELSSPDGDEDMGLEANVRVDGKTTTIALDSVYESYYGDTYTEDLSGVTIILSSSDKTPSMPKYTDILDMSAADFEALGNQLAGTIEALGSMLD